MGEPGDPTAKVMMTPVPAHLTTDDDQLTDAAGISVGRYGAKAVLAVPGAGALLSASVIAWRPLAMLSLPLLVHAERLTGSFALAGLVSRWPRRRPSPPGRPHVAGDRLRPGSGRTAARCGHRRYARSPPP